MGFEMGGAGAAGALFHWVAQTGEGLLVTSVWESEESFGKFMQERLIPASVKTGFTAQPDVTVCPLHCYLTQG